MAGISRYVLKRKRCFRVLAALSSENKKVRHGRRWEFHGNTSYLNGNFYPNEQNASQWMRNRNSELTYYSLIVRATDDTL